MKKLSYSIITLLTLCLLACNHQTESTKSIQEYTFVGGWEEHKIDTLCFDSLQMKGHPHPDNILQEHGVDGGGD